MALRGAPSKVGAINRNPKVNESVTFEDVPYTGSKPNLPTHRTVQYVSKDAGLVTERVEVSELTESWWEAVTSLPHCIAWRDSDWSFALATALIADSVHAGDMTRAAELRTRETQMWATADSRRANKVTYTEVQPESTSAVAQINDYRELYGS